MKKSEELQLRLDIETRFSRSVQKLALDIIANCPEDQLHFEGLNEFAAEVLTCCSMYTIHKILTDEIKAEKDTGTLESYLRKLPALDEDEPFKN